MKVSLDNPLVARAYEVAKAAHADQKRKYTGEPYLVHLVEVADLVAGAPGVTPEVIAAAFLHDIIEDQGYGAATLNAALAGAEGGSKAKVVSLVRQVTDVSQPGDGNRAVRKAMDLEHLARATAWGQTIKYADLISNTSTIAQHDLDFAKIYLPEKRAVLERLTSGDRGLRTKAMNSLRAAEAALLAGDNEARFNDLVLTHEAETQARDLHRRHTNPEWASW